MFRSEGCTLNPTGRANEEAQRDSLYLNKAPAAPAGWSYDQPSVYGKDLTKRLDWMSGMGVMLFYAVFAFTTGSLVYNDLILKEKLL